MTLAQRIKLYLDGATDGAGDLLRQIDASPLPELRYQLIDLLVEASIKYAWARTRERSECFWKKVYLQLVAEVHEAIGSDPLKGTKPALDSIRELRSKSI